MSLFTKQHAKKLIRYWWQFFLLICLLYYVNEMTFSNIKVRQHQLCRKNKCFMRTRKDVHLLIPSQPPRPPPHEPPAAHPAEHWSAVSGSPTQTQNHQCLPRWWWSMDTFLLVQMDFSHPPVQNYRWKYFIQEKTDNQIINDKEIK